MRLLPIVLLLSSIVIAVGEMVDSAVSASTVEVPTSYVITIVEQTPSQLLEAQDTVSTSARRDDVQVGDVTTVSPSSHRSTTNTSADIMITISTVRSSTHAQESTNSRGDATVWDLLT